MRMAHELDDEGHNGFTHQPVQSGPTEEVHSEAVSQ